MSLGLRVTQTAVHIRS